MKKQAVYIMAIFTLLFGLGMAIKKSDIVNDDERTLTSSVQDLQPVPFNVGYTVSVWCKYVDHWAQLMENILPYFDSYTMVGVKERELGIQREIKVTLDSVTPNNSFAMGNNDNAQRIIRSELNFTCETVLYKYMQKDTEGDGLIKNIWIWNVDVETPFSSQTIHISGGPQSELGG